MSARRYLCSELISLRINAIDAMVNLEEIWDRGAVFEAEKPIPEGARVEMRTAQALFAGKIIRVEQHEFGWRFEVEFSPLTPWSADQFLPRHLLEVSERKVEQK
ncbi:MAG TPA: hypothetical protein VK789_27395 [Bryobacteraceae bacterium]|jgi:hypothetical protein|nr:hypothetical protein [Bryobacteraceae bacterium]